jgi:hypothetical protein
MLFSVEPVWKVSSSAPVPVLVRVLAVVSSVEELSVHATLAATFESAVDMFAGSVLEPALVANVISQPAILGNAPVDGRNLLPVTR